MKVYISLPVTGTSDYKERAEAIEKVLTEQGHTVINPVKVCENLPKDTTHKEIKAGINCIEYANGSRHTVKDYARMAIQTASKRAYLTGEGEMRQSWGISTVIMNKRANACPKCLPFVGKVLIDDVWSGGDASDGNYPLMSSAIAAGLYHP